MNTRKGFFSWLSLVLVWIFFTNLFAAISVMNLRLFIQVTEIKSFIEENQLATYLYSNYQFFEATMFGLFFGSVFYFTNKFIAHSPIYKKSFGQIILIKSGIYILSIILIIGLIYGFYILFDIVPFGFNEIVDSGFLFSPSIIITIIYFGSLIILTNFFILTNRKFGPGNLFLIFLGKYHQPKVEDRIFMFIDLKASTTYAEQLGHLRYSKLIQSCFHDLNFVVNRYKADIYQYVGDEAVLTWTTKQGLKDLNCIRIFFAFQQKINTHASFYKKRYGIVPEFKAGLNAGQVTVAEVGDIKREIAYHGDVVNTGARIQHLCNDYKVHLLATEDFIMRVKNLVGFKSTLMGTVALRGKLKEVAVYAISEAEKKSKRSKRKVF
jgi:adenylate cyclase